MNRVLPILFNTDMVRAILDGRKTVTRRVVHRGKSYPEYHGRNKFYGVVDHLNNDYKNWYAGFYNANDVFTDSNGKQQIDALYWKAPYQPGDTLYVRETIWQKTGHYLDVDGETKFVLCNEFHYVATDEKPEVGWNYSWIKRPSIHMPKEAARIWLKVTDVRVERLQDITGKQCLAEGVEKEALSEVGEEFAKGIFHDIWDSTIKKTDLDRYGWSASPWVWVIEFERCEKLEREG